MLHRIRLLLGAGLLALLLNACGGPSTPMKPLDIDEAPPATTTSPPASVTPVPVTPTPTETPASGLTIKDVVFTHGLNEDMTPADTAESFTPEQEIYMSVKLDGNPKKGVISSRFFYNDQEIAEARVDLAQARDEQGVIFVIGGDTYVGFTLSHEAPFPVSANYRAALALDGEPAGEYSFRIAPPADAIPSRLLSATLATDVKAETYEPYKPTDAFPADQQVFLAGRVDLGNLSTLSAQWIIDGEVDEQGARTITANENIQDTPFYFSYLPEKGWPEGKHKVVLSIDDEPVGEYEFTIIPAQ